MGPMRTPLLSLSRADFGRPPVWASLAALRARQALGMAVILALAVLLAELPLRWAAASVAAAGAGFALLRFPWLIWPGLAVALPFASGVDLGPFSMADCLLAAAFGAWFVNGVRCNRLRLNVGFVPGLFLLFLLALLLSFPNSINLRKAIEGVIKWLEMLLIILLVQEAMPPGRVRWLVWGLLAGGRIAGLPGNLSVRLSHRPAQFPPAGPLHARRRDIRTTQSLRRLSGVDTARRSRPLPERAQFPIQAYTRAWASSNGQARCPRPTGMGRFAGSVRWLRWHSHRHRPGTAGQLEPRRLARRRRQPCRRPLIPNRPQARDRRAGRARHPPGRRFRTGPFHSCLIDRSICRPARLPGPRHVGCRAAACHQQQLFGHRAPRPLDRRAADVGTVTLVWYRARKTMLPSIHRSGCLAGRSRWATPTTPT